MKATTKTTTAATPNSGKERAIIEFSNADYAQVRACLLEAIDGSDFFSATVTSEHPAFESELVATIIVYRNSEGVGEPARTLSALFALSFTNPSGLGPPPLT